MKELTEEEKQEMHSLEQDLAYHAARADIEFYCKPVPQGAPFRERWYDTEVDDEDTPFVTQAARYLDLAGVLIRHPHNRALVRLT